MKCTRCGEPVSQDMLDQVADNFDVDFEYPTCWNCATELWKERQQDQTMKNPPQDEGDGPVPMTVAAHGPEAPKTHGEAQFFHDGFLSGATAYAAAVGHSTLKAKNDKLCEVFDVQGWRTIETFEKLQPSPAGEELARKYRAERPADEGPEGTREALERCAKMLETYGPDCFPANDKGQVHFARAMMDSTADEIWAFLKTLPDQPAKSCSRCNAGMPSFRVNPLCEECYAEDNTGYDAEVGDDNG